VSEESAIKEESKPRATLTRAFRCLRRQPEAREAVYDSFSMFPEIGDFRALEKLA